MHFVLVTCTYAIGLYKTCALLIHRVYAFFFQDIFYDARSKLSLPSICYELCWLTLTRRRPTMLLLTSASVTELAVAGGSWVVAQPVAWPRAVFDARWWAAGPRLPAAPGTVNHCGCTDNNKNVDISTCTCICWLLSFTALKYYYMCSVDCIILLFTSLSENSG